MEAVKVQVGGNHYKTKKFQPIELILGNEIGFCEGNVIKYVCRWKEKGGVQDLLKARQYLDFLIEKEQKDVSQTVLDPAAEVDRIRGTTKQVVGPKKNCGTCKYSLYPVDMEPCASCNGWTCWEEG